MATFDHIKFGDNLTVTDEGGGVIRVDGASPGSNFNWADTGFAPVSAYPPGYELDYVERTTNFTVTATTAATAQAVLTGNSITYDGVTAVMIEMYAYAIDVDANKNHLVMLWDGSTDLGRLCLWSPAAYVAGVVNAKRKLIPTAGAHTYSIRVWKSSAATANFYAGTGGADTALPAFLRITKA